MNPLMVGKGYGSLIGLGLMLIGKLVGVLGAPDIGEVIEEIGIGVGSGGLVRKGAVLGMEKFKRSGSSDKYM